MNLVGHVAVAVDRHRPRGGEFLLGCVLPDIAAIARVRLRGRPDGELGRGVAFHHACDSVFHDSEWFRTRSRDLRDELLERGVDAGPARACAHAGLEMVLDGVLVRDVAVASAIRASLERLAVVAPRLGTLVESPERDRWITVATRVGRTLDPDAYGDSRAVAERLVRMTAGRRRIELRPAHVDVVADTLARRAEACDAEAPGVVAAVRAAVAG